MKVSFAPLPLLLALCGPGCTTVERAPAQAPQVISPTEWGGVERPVDRPRQAVAHLTVHHGGVRWEPGTDVQAYMRRLQQWSRETKGWVDIPYHYIIAPDGKIYAGRSPLIAGDTNTEYDTQGHVQVMLLGNFEEQVPTSSQWDSGVQLLSHLLRAHGLAPSSIGAHLHHSKQTACPGANLMVRFEELRAAAARGSGR